MTPHAKAKYKPKVTLLMLELPKVDLFCYLRLSEPDF